MAESEVEREKVIRFFDENLSTLLDDKRRGRMVVIQQRTHQADLTVHLLAKDGSTISITSAPIASIRPRPVWVPEKNDSATPRPLLPVQTRSSQCASGNRANSVSYERRTSAMPPPGACHSVRPARPRRGNRPPRPRYRTDRPEILSGPKERTTRGRVCARVRMLIWSQVSRRLELVSSYSFCLRRCPLS